MDAALATCIAALIWLLLVATSGDYAMTWDEGHTVRREETLASWFGKVFRGSWPERSAAFSQKILEQSWPFAREEPDGHPPFYALLGLAGWIASRSICSPLTAYRMGPMALAAITAGCVYFHLATRRGRWAGLVASAGMFTIPQVFSLAHYAHYDMPMSCLWILAQFAFLKARTSRLWSIPFGMLVGMAIGTKFTGLFAVVPAIVWVISAEWLPRIRISPGSASRPVGFSGTITLVLSGFIAILTLYAMIPPWWLEPIDGFHRFLASNLSRSRTKPIPTLYLGQIYPFALPWHNTLVLSAISLPVGLMGLAAIGGFGSLIMRPVDREGLFWVMNWLTLMVVRALPFTPGHDGLRLFLPSVLSLAILAGIGMSFLARGKIGWTRLFVVTLVTVTALGEGLFGIFQLYPYTLSYYNAASGGLKGAERNGFEVTYYWDTLGNEFLRWVREEDRKRELSLRFPSDLINVRCLREWEVLPRRIPIVGMENPERPDYVLQRRRGVYYPYDSWLEANGRPEFVIRRQGVDLLRIYPFDESFRAYQATRDTPLPAHLRE